MAQRIRDNKIQSDKILRSLVPQISHMCFGFSHVTSNRHYGIKQFSKTADEADTYESLFIKLADLSSIDVNEAKQRGKKLGLERIPYKQLSQPMRQICDASNLVSKDSNVCVFQFCNHNYRIICKEDIIHSNVMHVLAFDLDFSAYKHG